MIANIGPIGAAILVIAALLTLVCVRHKPAPDAEPAQDEPWARNAPKPSLAPGPVPEAPEVQAQDIRPYANGAVSIGESSTPAISVRDLKEAAK